MPEIIAPNTAFWVKVYAQYTTSKGIIHDDTDLNRIYDVIDLIPYDVPDTEKTNRTRIKAAVARYESILQCLALESNTDDEDCRRVAGLFDEPRDERQFARAAARVRCQIGQKDRFQAGLIRSGAYLDQIRDILRANGLPEDLAYLPHVESSFNPNAYSKFGAAGMWQFTRSTGQRFMEVGYVLDERRDPILSTHAAAALLKENFEKLGSWPLAITAYNHGAAGMQRAKALHDDYAQIFQRYSSPSFKFASRNFYAEFLAARHVAANFQAYFGELKLDEPASMKTVVLEDFASFGDLSKHFKVDPETLKQMNLALRQPVFSGQKHVPKGYALRLPAGSATGESLTASIPDALYRKTQKPSRFYTVQPGDTASKVARMHAISVTDLVAANKLDRKAIIQPRQTLRIPGAGEQVPAQTTLAAAAPTAIETAIAAAIPSGDADGVPYVKTASATTLETPKPQQFPQPTLASVVPLPALEAAVESEDQQLASAQEQARNEQIVTADVRFGGLFENKGGKIGIIQVEVEETLGHYAEWAGVRTQQIRALNGLRFDSVLQLHQKVKIPLHRINAEIFEQNRYEYHKRLQEDFFAVYRIGDLRAYQVRGGDNYWKLCQEKFQIPMWLLKHANPDADLADLRIGRKLMIPVIEKASSTDADPGIEEESDQEAIVPSHDDSGDAETGMRGLKEVPRAEAI